MRRPFIALYGITNLGKTTQLEMLNSRAAREERTIVLKKYPVYDLAPTGPLIHEAIKGGNPKGLSAGEIQALMARNRFDYQPTLEQYLGTESVSAVIAEMYTGTGIAYGIGDGVNEDYLLALNEKLLVPDISILLDGRRFTESIERGHRFEEDDEKTERIRATHLELAARYGWSIVNANRTREAVNDEIWSLIAHVL